MLTDVNLGDGITGWELARRAREIAPGFPVNMRAPAPRIGNHKASTAAS